MAVPSSFGFFKKKDKLEPDKVSQPAETSASEAVLVSEVQSILQKAEDSMVQKLSSRLSEMHSSAAGSYKNLAKIADDLEKEKVKLDEDAKRFGPTIENARRTIVATLRREAAAELVVPTTLADVKKFRDRLEASMNRFGEATGSHSKLMNFFLSKQSDKMKGEFENLSGLLKNIRSLMAEFEERRAPMVKCGNTVNTILQKATSIKSAEAAIAHLEEKIESAEKELEKTKLEYDSLKASNDFSAAEQTAEKLQQIEKRISEFNGSILNLFSHASRAFGKYSYGVSKETERLLDVMTQEPWKIFYENDSSQYVALLNQISQSISSGQMPIKDSERILRHLNSIVTSMPELQNSAKALLKEKQDLAVGNAKELVQKARALQNLILRQTEEVSHYRQELDLEKKQMLEKKSEIDRHLLEASEALSDITEKRYAVCL